MDWGCVQANVRWLMRRYGTAPEKLAEVIGVSRRTVFTRLSDPGTFTVRELGLIALYYDVPASSLLEEKLK